MGNGRAHEAARKARRLAIIPDYRGLFYDGSDIARKAALQRLELWNLDAESDKELRRKLAEAQRNRDNAHVGPATLKAFATREKHMADAARALSAVIESFGRPIPEFDEARKWLRIWTVGPLTLTKRGRGERHDTYKASAATNIVSLKLRDKDGDRCELDRDDARVLLAAMGMRLQGRLAG